ncbi:ParB/RepB/Spo0J family partition protein [Mycobacterium intracellulare]|uniref:ParB/RepB/Spo0J family partition protein n=1 Tax=Mycobacterium intracellulare TaxID=1767 RepID=UPI000448B6DD|nr:ParB N-terminal domain-containing protein [Mycobacterium intracellulare]ETZ38105.1 parB-like nuclease domain protein [Mycobacterium intracellulare MIN_052511_1280]
MTDTITTEAEQTTSEHPAPGVIEHLDPHSLILDTNVRDEAALGAQFVASIKEHGVLTPIAAVRDRDGQLRVRSGQRRTLAAREAGLASVPVYVRAATAADDDKAQLVERVSEQIVENDQRAQLTELQRTRGIQQMIEAGVSITRVAKKLSVGKDTVKAAAAAAKSQAAMQGLAEGQLSLGEAAALTEFEDLPGAISRLIQVAGSRSFEHVVAQLRQERAAAEAEATAAQPYVQRGFTWLQERPGNSDPGCIALHHLLTADGAQADEQAVTDPAQWAVQFYETEIVVDVETGEAVDEDDVDWDTQDQPEATPAEGLRHACTVTEATGFVPQYFCLDFRAAGLTPEPWFARRAGLSEDTGDSTVDLDADAVAARRERAEAERAEADKRERRKVLALNKLGDAAMGVRRDFLTKLLARKTPPKGAAIFVATCLAGDPYLLTHHNAQETTAELLGIERAAVAKQASELGANGDNRAQVITLALVLGALESATPKDAWRGAAHGYGPRVGSAGYLRWLAANDYPLAAVEEIITGTTDAETVYSEYLSDAGKQ